MSISPRVQGTVTLGFMTLKGKLIYLTIILAAASLKTELSGLEN